MRLSFFIVLSSLFVVACDRPLPQHEFSGATMGTTFNVSIANPNRDTRLNELEPLFRDVLDDIERQTSTYIQESELAQFNNAVSTDWINVSASLCALISRSLELSRQTNGAFDITVGPLVDLWGFGPAGNRSEPPSDAEIDERLSFVGFEKLTADCARPALRKLHSDLHIDLSGWVKGHAADVLADKLIAIGIDNFLVEVGGEMRLQGHNSRKEPWSVAIEKPTTDGREIQSVLPITNTGLATSGDYRNFFEHAGTRYSHTIDPRTGRPVMHQLASVTVKHRLAATADGLATALLVLGPTDGMQLAESLGLDAIFVLRTPEGFTTFSSQSPN